jgi:hypothetical protein
MPISAIGVARQNIGSTRCGGRESAGVNPWRDFIKSKMLTNLEEGLTVVKEKLGMVMGKLAELLQTKRFLPST